MIERLFVYGTLKPGAPNEHFLSNIVGSWEAATVIGTLHPEGWGATMGYPAIELDDHGSEVEGFVFSSKNLSKHWKELDEFEGEGYKRVLTKVKLKNNSRVDAFIYVLRK